MADITTTAKFTADISSLKTAMQQAQRQVKLVTSEFRAATAGMDDWTKSEEGLAAKLKQLNGILDAQKKKLAVLNAELKNAEETDGKGSAAADRLRTSINNLQASITKTEKDIAQYNKQLEELPETMEDAGDAADKASEGFTVFKGALAGLVADGVRVAISAFKELAKESIQVGMDFESAMSKVGAVSGASAEEMQQLTDKAKEMGENTKFSATESAEAFNYMAMAGWKTEEMLDGIEGVMNLAAASGADSLPLEYKWRSGRLDQQDLYSICPAGDPGRCPVVLRHRHFC
jgi:chromosome segregation ATPase